jgi:hypothetical protein
MECDFGVGNAVHEFRHVLECTSFHDCTIASNLYNIHIIIQVVIEAQEN